MPKIVISGVKNSNISVSGANSGERPTIRLQGLENVNLDTAGVLKLISLAGEYASISSETRRAEIVSKICELCNCTREQAHRILILNKPDDPE